MDVLKHDGLTVRSLQKITTINSPEITRIPDRDNGEIMVPLFDLDRICLPSGTNRVIEGIEDSQNMVARVGVRERLVAATSVLPEGYGLVLIEGYRTYEHQKQLFDKKVEKLQEIYPNLEDAKRKANIFVSDPDICSPHVTGGAVDVGLVRIIDGKADSKKWEYIDVGNQFEYDEKAATDCKDLTDEQRKNRQILTDAMTQAGFVNYPKEWWHWSYGDKLWAYLTQEDYAIYGLVKDPDLLSSQEPVQI